MTAIVWTEGPEIRGLARVDEVDSTAVGWLAGGWSSMGPGSRCMERGRKM